MSGPMVSFPLVRVTGTQLCVAAVLLNPHSRKLAALPGLVQPIFSLHRTKQLFSELDDFQALGIKRLYD